MTSIARANGSVNLDVAEALHKAGVPVFWARILGPDDHPSRSVWEEIGVDYSEIEHWKKVHGLGLCARMGFKFDVIDYDPRNDLSGEGLAGVTSVFRKFRPSVYMRVATPSGGWHWWIASLGLGARKCRFDGVDYLGYGRLCFIPPTARRPKNEDGKCYGDPVPYSTFREVSLDAEAVRCPGLAEALLAPEETRARTPAELASAMRSARPGSRNDAFYPWVYRLQTLFEDPDVVDIGAPYLLKLGWHRTLAAAERDIRRHLARGDRRPSITVSAGSLSFRSAASVIPRNVSWALEDRAPRGAFVLCAGRGGEGKSHALITWVADWTRGTVPGCWFGSPVSCLWATVESSLDIEVVPRYRAAHGDLSRLSFVTVESSSSGDDHIRIFDPAYIEELRERVVSSDIKVIVLDPVLDVLESGIKTGEQQAVRAAIGRLNAFAEEMDILILGIAHFNKMITVSSAVDRITGSAAFSQRPRAVMSFAYDRESSSFVVSQAKNNWGKVHLPSLSFRICDAAVVVSRAGKRSVIHTSRVEWEEESAVSVDEILGRSADGRSQKPAVKTNECREWLVGVLNQGSLSDRLSGNIVTVGEEFGYSKPLIYRLAIELGVMKSEAPKDLVKPGPGRRSLLWSLPEKLSVSDKVRP